MYVYCGPAQRTSWSMIGKNSCTALGLALRRFSSVLITAERAGEVASCAATGSTGRLRGTRDQACWADEKFSAKHESDLLELNQTKKPLCSLPSILTLFGLL